MLRNDLDDAVHYRPTEEFFSKGWFARIEKYLVSEERPYFQTVVTKKGREPVFQLLREALPKYPLKSKQKSRCADAHGKTNG